MSRCWCLIEVMLLAVTASSLAQNVSTTTSEPPETTIKQDHASEDDITAKILKTVSAALAVAFIATFGLAPCTFAFLFGCIGFTKSGVRAGSCAAACYSGYGQIDKEGNFFSTIMHNIVACSGRTKFLVFGLIFGLPIGIIVGYYLWFYFE